MSEELRPCPLCGAMPDKLRTGYMCSTLGCALQEHTVSEKEWNTRPIEDELQAENERLKEELQHEKTRSQLNLEAEERRMLNITYYCAEIDALTARIAELEAEVTKGHELQDSYCDRIAELEANNDRLQDTWFVEETICPDGSLKPKASALLSRIAELEAAQARWVMVSERLPKESGWYIAGLLYFWGSPYSCEVYFDAENIEPRWNNSTSDRIYCWLEGIPELPQPPEVQESEATACKFCGSDKSDIRMNSIVCSSCGRKIGNIAPPEVQE